MTPEPLTNETHNVEGLDGFLLNTEKLMASELWALATGEEFKAAVGLWCRAWKQSPPGSLPNDQRVLAGFSGAGGRWPKVREMALRGFILCSDGRLYHETLCEDVVRATEAKKKRHVQTKAATEARKQQRDEQRNDERSGGETLNVTKSHRRELEGKEERLGENVLVDSLGAASGAKANRGSRIPNGFLPDEKAEKLAVELGFSPAQAQACLDNFRDYWLGAAGQKGVKLDWQATFRNWLRNDRKRGLTHGTAQRRSVVDTVLDNLS